MDVYMYNIICIYMYMYMPYMYKCMIASKTNSRMVIPISSYHYVVCILYWLCLQAPVSMKAVCQAAWLWTVAFGNLIVIIIAEGRIFENQVCIQPLYMYTSFIIVYEITNCALQ